MPVSSALLTDANTMITNGPTAATSAAAIAAAGPIQDMVSHLALYRLKILEIKTLLTQMKNATDGADPNLTLINNALLTYV